MCRTVVSGSLWITCRARRWARTPPGPRVLRVGGGGRRPRPRWEYSEVVADKGEQLPAVLGGDRLRCHGVADHGGVDTPVVQPAQVHAVVAGPADDALHVAVRVETGLAQNDPGEDPGAGVRRGYRQPLVGQVGQGGQAGAGEEPEQRAGGVDIDATQGMPSPSRDSSVRPSPMAAPASAAAPRPRCSRRAVRRGRPRRRRSHAGRDVQVTSSSCGPRPT